MATITQFEDLEIWRFGQIQTNEFDALVEPTLLAKDFELRNQMNASSGSVMDCIAEGFDRSGNNEFKNFLIIAKDSNGEFRSQLYRCLDRKHIIKEKFDELYAQNITLGNKIMSFITYLQNSALKANDIKLKTLPNNLKRQTSNIEPAFHDKIILFK
jgi:four helix bundle protein